MTTTRNSTASVVDAATFTVRRTIDIAAPVEKVWAAVTEAEHISRWFGRAEITGHGVGATGTLSWPEHRPVPLRVEAFEAPHTVSYRWSNDEASGTARTELDVAHSTVFTFTLEPLSHGTRLTVVETGFEATSDPIATLEDHRKGWDGELDKLVALLESGS
ncbi:MAG: SRPBCC domain-containing protein [Ornithinibacter sp.]